MGASKDLVTVEIGHIEKGQVCGKSGLIATRIWKHNGAKKVTWCPPEKYTQLLEKRRARARKYYHANRETKSEQAKIRREKNIETYRAYHRAKYYRNREAVLAKQKKRRLENPDHLSAVQKAYRDKRRAIFNARAKAYKQKDPIAFRQRASKWARTKYKTDPNYRLRRLVGRGLIKLIARGAKKNAGTIEYLGCTVAECRKHLEGMFRLGMDWNNHGPMGWHIDHIKPLCSFDFMDEAQVRAALHYTNLQPLWWHENLSKGTKVA